MNVTGITDVQEPGLRNYIRDIDCTPNTPVRFGANAPIYGSGKRIRPAVTGRRDTDYFRKIYLPELLPLEEYDLFVVLFSGGKDSAASYYKLLELGVPKSKIELWTHDIDGGNVIRHMDWRCTHNYVRAFAKAEQVPLRISWRVNGFYGELYRIGASEPVEWQEPGDGTIKQCRLSPNYKKCLDIKKQAVLEIDEFIEQNWGQSRVSPNDWNFSQRWYHSCFRILERQSEEYIKSLVLLEKTGGKRLKFPAKGGTHQGRWCSGGLKASVQDTVTANLELIRQNCKVLVVSGERRGESVGRSRYNEIELHRTSAVKKANRLVHQWRPVIDYSEMDVWEALRRHCLNPHPCYRAGWNRCSCAMCIFSTPSMFAGIRELMPREYELLRSDEKILGFTIDNHKDLDKYVGTAGSCVYHGDKAALHSIMTGEFNANEVYVHGDWSYPAGAFHGSAGGPC